MNPTDVKHLLITVIIVVALLFASLMGHVIRKSELEHQVIQSAVERNGDPIATACAMNVKEKNEFCEKFLILKLQK
jgi:hypothetical protein